MRRGTLITLIVLFVVLVVVAVRQLTIATSDHDPYPGPTVTNQLPETTSTVAVTSPGPVAGA